LEGGVGKTKQDAWRFCCCLDATVPPAFVARVALKRRSNQMEVKCVKGGKFTLRKNKEQQPEK